MEKRIISIALAFLLLGIVNAQTISVPSNIYANSTFPITISGIAPTNNSISLISLNVAGNSYMILYNNTTANAFGFINSTGNYTISAMYYVNNTQIASLNITVQPNPSDTLEANLNTIQADMSNLSNGTNVNISTLDSNIVSINSQISGLNSQISDINAGLSSLNNNVSGVSSYAQNLTNYTISSFVSLNTNILPQFTSEINATNSQVANDYKNNNTLGIVALALALAGIIFTFAITFLRRKPKEPKATPRDMALNMAKSEIAKEEGFRNSLKNREEERKEFKASLQEIKGSKQYKKLEKELDKAEEMAKKNGLQVQRKDLPQYKKMLEFLESNGIDVKEEAKRLLTEKISNAENEAKMIKNKMQLEQKRQEISEMKRQLGELE